MAAETTKTFRLAKDLSEDTVLPAVTSKDQAIIVDLSDVRHLNSAGIRIWVIWARQNREANPGIRVELQNLPPAFVRMSLLVKDLIPDAAIVRSLQVRLSCINCDHTEDLLVQNEKGLAAKLEARQADPANHCPACKSPLELDSVPEVYEALSRYAPA